MSSIVWQTHPKFPWVEKVFLLLFLPMLTYTAAFIWQRAGPERPPWPPHTHVWCLSWHGWDSWVLWFSSTWPLSMWCLSSSRGLSVSSRAVWTLNSSWVFTNKNKPWVLWRPLLGTPCPSSVCPFHYSFRISQKASFESVWKEATWWCECREAGFIWGHLIRIYHGSIMFPCLSLLPSNLLLTQEVIQYHFSV